MIFMTVETFLILLTIFSTVTSLCTEATKKLLDSIGIKYASNVIVLIDAVCVGGLGMLAFYLLKGYPLNTANIIFIVLMVVSNWLGSMIGYDKVKQAIQQYKGK